MAGFDFLFEGFTLLLGLAMAEALGGYAAMLKLRARRRVPGAPESDHPPPQNPQRIGFLLPLLILMFLAMLSTFWLDIYQIQNQLPFNLASVLCVLLFIGSYYVIASLLWPEHPEAWADLDDYYFAHRKFVVLGMIGLSLAQEAALTFADVEYPELPAPPEFATLGLVGDIATAAGIVALLALPFVRRRWLSLLLLLTVLASVGLDATASAFGFGMYVPVVLEGVPA